MLRERGLPVFLFLLAVAVVYPYFPWLLPPVMGLLYGFLRKRNQRPGVALLFLVFLVMCSHELREVRYKRLSGRVGDPVRVTGLIRQVTWQDRYISVDLLAASLRDYEGHRLTLPGSMRVTLSGTNGYAPLDIGTVLEARGQLRERRVYRNPGTDRTTFYRARNGLFYVSVSTPMHMELARPKSESRWAHLNPFDIGVPYPVLDVLRGMVSGNRDALPEPLRDRVQELGIYHLFVVSGFHFGIFFSAAYLLLMLLPLRARYRKGLALVVLFFLLPMTGFSAPAVRAFLMIALYLVCSLKDIRMPPTDAVGLAGMLLLIWNPWQAFDPGFLLSFLVSGGIVVSLQETDKWWHILCRVPFLAFLLSFPIMLGWFGRVPLTGPLVNLVMTPVVTVIFYLFLLVQLQLPLTGLLETMVTGMLWLMDWMPVRNMGLVSMAGGWIGLVGVAGYLLIPGKKRKWVALLAGTGLSLLAALVPPAAGGRMVVPDTGQSQAVLIQEKGVNWLFDAAGEWEGRLALIPRLRSLGVKRIDALFLSHFDADHAGGVPELLDEIPVERVFAPDAGGPGQFACRIRSKLDQHGIPLILLNSTMPDVRSGPLLRAVIVHPVDTPVPEGRGNDRSLGVELTAGVKRITLLGDLDGEPLIRLAAQLQHADILLAPHHGSRRAAISTLRDRVNPDIVICCCGRNNRYHFPSSAFTDLFSESTFITTAQRGEIQVELDR